MGVGLVRRQQHRSAVPGWCIVAARGNKSSAMRGVKKENLPTKICVVCDRPFTWRKKWERCWDEVTTCSKSCNASRKRDKNGNGDNAADADASDEDDEGGAGGTSDGGGGGGGNGRDAKREQRKANKKAVKASKRSKRAGGDGGDGDGVAAELQNNNDDGRKSCDGCGKRVDLLIRCQDDGSKRWKMLCGGKCWKNASGGVPDGDADHPHYRYGGLWKNRRAGRHVSTAVPALNDDGGEPYKSSSEEEEKEEEEEEVEVEVEAEVEVGREEEEKEKDANRQLAGLQLA